MVGCRHGAKNTLVKNYLWFAERLGARVLPERHATEIRPIGAPDGSGGYMVTSVRSGAWLRRERRTMTARGVVVAAGPLGTNQLLADCKHTRALPRLSPRLGEVVRTNTESIQAVTAPMTAATSRARWRSPPASTPTPTRTSRWSPTAARPT